MDVSKSCANRFAIYTYFKSLCHSPETDTVNYISIKLGEERRNLHISEKLVKIKTNGEFKTILLQIKLSSIYKNLRKNPEH